MRLDQYLVFLKKAKSRTWAHEMIKKGQVEVLVSEKFITVKKPSFECQKGQEVRLREDESLKWVSRAGGKLYGAFSRLSMNLKNKKILDLGQSTGGFTQVCLERGASQVVGVDVGRGQLVSSLKEDSRVDFYESQDARNLSFLREESFDFFVMDLSFISAQKVLPQIKELDLKEGGLVLVKPQFEVGRSLVGKGGLVEKSQIHLFCQKEFCQSSEDLGFVVADYFPSDVKGKDGNQEFFCYLRV